MHNFSLTFLYEYFCPECANVHLDLLPVSLQSATHVLRDVVLHCMMITETFQQSLHMCTMYVSACTCTCVCMRTNAKPWRRELSLCCIVPWLRLRMWLLIYLQSFGPHFILSLVLADNVQGAPGVEQREGTTL